MRRVLSFCCALAPLLAGLILAYSQLVGSVFAGGIMLAAGFIIALGAYWLWADFLKPGRQPE